jgi:putative NIF3 family GTP cyclohydrolase 1 type 2
VVTAVATHDVIRRAGDLKANLVITHEPIFYNHLDETEWLSSDPVFVAKRKLAEERKIVVFRFHDGWHRLSGDSVQNAIVRQLGWERYVDVKEPGVCAIPPMLLRDLVLRVKDNLDIRTVRTIGDADFVVNRVFVAPGAWNGKDLMPMVERHKVDAVVTGEVREWEMSEYIRDSNAQGKPRALVVTGHVMGEEGAMKALVDWLAPKLPGVPVVHIPAGDPFKFS